MFSYFIVFYFRLLTEFNISIKKPLPFSKIKNQYIALYNDKQHIETWLDAHKICFSGLIFYHKWTNEMRVEKKENGKWKLTIKCENQNEEMWIENSKS
jgi:hypothetical protein